MIIVKGSSNVYSYEYDRDNLTLTVTYRGRPGTEGPSYEYLQVKEGSYTELEACVSKGGCIARIANSHEWRRLSAGGTSLPGPAKPGATETKLRELIKLFRKNSSQQLFYALWVLCGSPDVQTMTPGSVLFKQCRALIEEATGSDLSVTEILNQAAQLAAEKNL